MVMLPQQVNDAVAWEAVSTVSHLSLRNKLQKVQKREARGLRGLLWGEIKVEKRKTGVRHEKKKYKR